ncbi:hypothetical protein DSO57_1001547 [Entomophthora muscae]|uniref:Uncharacterized protein n=1 Tax=Entomophthora muscae TaxID=34485 RepID=A0ACC2RNZ2_9FUNG|nr:hypothetical protein DSO57_1001547 [Entomophthora muscae]
MAPEIIKIPISLITMLRGIAHLMIMDIIAAQEGEDVAVEEVLGLSLGLEEGFLLTIITLQTAQTIEAEVTPTPSHTRHTQVLGLEIQIELT